jgi:hypothetical protein
MLPNGMGKLGTLPNGMKIVVKMFWCKDLTTAASRMFDAFV